MPNAVNHRLGSLVGYERVFSLISVGRIRAGLANWETMEVAALAIRPVSDAAAAAHAVVRGCIFEIPQEELAALKEREHRYRLAQLAVIDHSKPPAELGGEQGTTLCYVVLEQSNEEYRRCARILFAVCCALCAVCCVLCAASVTRVCVFADTVYQPLHPPLLHRRSSMSAEEYQRRVGDTYPLQHTAGFLPAACGELWGRADIKPLRAYLVMCLQAAVDVDREQVREQREPQDFAGMGMRCVCVRPLIPLVCASASCHISCTRTLTPRSLLANFLDHCHLTDGTTVRQYMLTHAERFPEELLLEVQGGGRGR